MNTPGSYDASPVPYGAQASFVIQPQPICYVGQVVRTVVIQITFPQAMPGVLMQPFGILNSRPYLVTAGGVNVPLSDYAIEVPSAREVIGDTTGNKYIVIRGLSFTAPVMGAYLVYQGKIKFVGNDTVYDLRAASNDSISAFVAEEGVFPHLTPTNEGMLEQIDR